MGKTSTPYSHPAKDHHGEDDHPVKGVKAYTGQRTTGGKQGRLQTQLGVASKVSIVLLSKKLW